VNNFILFQSSMHLRMDVADEGGMAPRVPMDSNFERPMIPRLDSDVTRGGTFSQRYCQNISVVTRGVPAMCVCTMFQLKVWRIAQLRELYFQFFA
jgi:hypothetical protein